MLLVHIVIALASLIQTTYAFLAPSQRKLQVSYALVAGTLVTGTYLTVLHPGHLIEACATGLVYVTVVLGATVLTRNKLVQTTS